MSTLHESIDALVHAHEEWRESCINLIAAENVTSTAVKEYLHSDLTHRYGDYLGRDLHARKYFGNRYLVAIEEQTAMLAEEVFGAAFVELRAISGHVAGAAVIMSFTTPGALVLEPGSNLGGHRLASKLSVTPLTPLEVEFLPMDEHAYNVDVGAAVETIRRRRPPLVILGSSNFLFPHPVAEIAENLPEETRLVYDASHVLGLIAGGEFQDPLREGASLVFGSTHKTFPGPPGGIIFANDKEAIEMVSKAVYPGLITNHHPARSPAMAIALLEMKKWGQEYARAIVQNAQFLGAELQNNGVEVVGADHGFTRSHTLLLATAEHGSGKEVGTRLEEAGIITNSARLPESLGSEGVRIGVQEFSRRSPSRDDIKVLAALMAAAITRTRGLETVRTEVAELAKSLGPLQYSWGEDG